jgi:hypothetical protein
VEFLAGCGLGFLTVESSYFIKMLATMNDVYVKKYLTKADAFTRTWLPKLYDSVKAQVKKSRDDEPDLLRTLGSDTLKGVNGDKTDLITDAYLENVEFRDCIPLDEGISSAANTAAMWRSIMIEVAGSVDKVEDHYAAIAADNTAVNPAAGRLIAAEFPKVFFNGCRSHAADLLCGDIAKIDEVKEVIDDTKESITFIKAHRRVTAA